jgi:hypothetical protein
MIQEQLLILVSSVTLAVILFVFAVIAIFDYLRIRRPIADVQKTDMGLFHCVLP